VGFALGVVLSLDGRDELSPGRAGVADVPEDHGPGDGAGVEGHDQPNSLKINVKRQSSTVNAFRC
ncbi:hypothetical protein, partial [Escherichia coli]|uniref:hypothetical protein n=1 Tax=Escherichia coli TaxID=562 RepID=UPI001BDB7D33